MRSEGDHSHAYPQQRPWVLLLSVLSSLSRLTCVYSYILYIYYIKVLEHNSSLIGIIFTHHLKVYSSMAEQDVRQLVIFCLQSYVR